MAERPSPIVKQILKERFGKDSLIALATAVKDVPYVRAVNAYYEEGAFYIVTHALSNKMKQLEKNPLASIAGEWFTAQGTGENIGHVRDEKNAVIAQTLRGVFAGWYSNGHVDEADPNTCILRIRLTEGVLFSNGRRYDITF